MNFLLFNNRINGNGARTVTINFGTKTRLKVRLFTFIQSNPSNRLSVLTFTFTSRFGINFYTDLRHTSRIQRIYKRSSQLPIRTRSRITRLRTAFNDQTIILSLYGRHTNQFLRARQFDRILIRFLGSRTRPTATSFTATFRLVKGIRHSVSQSHGQRTRRTAKTNMSLQVSTSRFTIRIRR